MSLSAVGVALPTSGTPSPSWAPVSHPVPPHPRPRPRPCPRPRPRPRRVAYPNRAADTHTSHRPVVFRSLSSGGPSAGHRTAGQSPHSRPGMRHGRRRGADGGARNRYGTPVRNTGQPSSLTEMAAANGVRCASRKSHMSQRSSHLSGRFGRVNDRSSGHGVIAGWALS